MKHRLLGFVLLISLCSPSHLFAQEETDSTLLEMMNLKASEDPSELQKVLNAKVGASSKKALSSREAPGIVTIITAEEIMLTGARDLVDVFRLVPGLDIGGDIELFKGIGVRGNWSLEGKVLLLIDGIEQNETMYQNIVLGNRYAVDQIARIEIIRGPGSTNYGGSAAYGVINIITKGAAGEDGIYVAGRYGHFKDTYARKTASITSVNSFGKLRADASFFIGQHSLTDQDSAFIYQYIKPTKDSTTQNPMYLNVGLKYGNTEFRTIYDNYETNNAVYQVKFKGFYAMLKHQFKFKKLSITPVLSFSQQTPWEYSKTYGNYDEFYYPFDITTKRYKASVSAIYTPIRRLSFVLGTEYFLDQGIDNLGLEYLIGNKAEYSNISVYGEGIFQHRLVNVTAGLRLDSHSAFSTVIVPRFALTKRINDLHFKALASGAYRAPSIANMATNPQVKPEQSKVGEFEVGYQFTPKMLLTANFYYIGTKNTIVYFATSNDSDSIINGGRFGSRGLELEYKYISERWWATANYSFYKSNPNNSVADYAVPGNSSLNLAFPGHKITGSFSAKITDDISANTTLIWASKRYAYIDVDDEGNSVLGQLDPYLLANINLRYNNIAKTGFFAGLSVYDLFDTFTPFAQPYDGYFGPIPSGGREISIQLGYQLDYKKSK